MMYIYRTYFKLVDFQYGYEVGVSDLEAAQAYLSSDDMTEYIKTDSRINASMKQAIENIAWHLTTESSGDIELITNRAMTDAELADISDWVSGQNSDGLGEGFEQQDFAMYQILEDDDEYDDDEWGMASFDWKTNDYKFEFIRND